MEGKTTIWRTVRLEVSNDYDAKLAKIDECVQELRHAIDELRFYDGTESPVENDEAN